MPSGGLAARAAELFARSQNSLSLWQIEVEHQLAASRRPKPDIRFKIEKILHIPLAPASDVKAAHRSSSSAGIALCRIISTSAVPGLIASRLELHRTVFSFSSLPPAGDEVGVRSPVRNPDDFVEGREVHVWTPWQQISRPKTEMRELFADMEVSSILIMCTRFVIL